LGEQLIISIAVLTHISGQISNEYVTEIWGSHQQQYIFQHDYGEHLFDCLPNEAKIIYWPNETFFRRLT